MSTPSSHPAWLISDNREVPLRDHIATVTGYLNDYRKSSAKNRKGYSSIFSDYLTSVCWRKNHRRINHPATISLIAKLDCASDLVWDAVDLSKVLPSKPDNSLAERFHNLHQGGRIREIMRFLRSREHSDEFPELLDRCKPGGSRVLVCSKHTIKEFHDLFIAVLITYAVLHQNMFATAETLRPDGEGYDETKIDSLRQRLEEDASNVTNVARLLQAILNSHALASLLRFLADIDALELPIRMSPYDAVFASKNHMEPVPLRRDRKKAKKRSLDVEVTKSSQNSGEGKHPNACVIHRKHLHERLGEAEDEGVGQKDLEGHESDDLCEADSVCARRNSGEGDDSGEGGEVNEEQQTFHDQKTERGIASVICGWLKSLISHYSSKRILEDHCVKQLTLAFPDDDVRIRLLVVKGIRRQVANWEEMKNTITNAMPFTSVNAISILESKIKATGTISIPIFSTFRRLLRNENVWFYFLVHCEAFLAAFAKFGVGSDSMAVGQELIEISKVTFIPLFFFLLFSVTHQCRIWISEG